MIPLGFRITFCWLRIVGAGVSSVGCDKGCWEACDGCREDTVRWTEGIGGWGEVGEETGWG